MNYSELDMTCDIIRILKKNLLSFLDAGGRLCATCNLGTGY